MIILFWLTFSQTARSFKTSNILICFYSFDLSCPTLKKDNSIENLYIVSLIK